MINKAVYKTTTVISGVDQGWQYLMHMYITDTVMTMMITRLVSIFSSVTSCCVWYTTVLLYPSTYVVVVDNLIHFSLYEPH